MPASLQVFVLGAARSGTSITYYALREIFNLPGAGESHVMPIFQRLIHQFYLYQRRLTEHDPNVLAASLRTPDFRRHIVEYVREFYARTYPELRWVDKTPGGDGILSSALIQEAFPAAKLICTKRSGIEVVQSYRTKFAARFEEACNAWTGSMNALLKARASCRNLLEIDQYDIANSPETIARKLVDHIGMPDKDEALTEFFRKRRTDQLSSHDWRNRMTMEMAGWSEAECRIFTERCGELMSQLGYPM